MKTVHIIGAGLAGLAAAVRLAGSNIAVGLYESAGQAGGRCRSFFDKNLGQTIDNGNHLLMSGNHSALTYLDEIGTRDSLMGPKQAAYPFVDLMSDERWVVRPSKGIIPFWILNANSRVPGTVLGDYMRSLPILWPSADQTVADVIQTSGPLYKRFWQPLTLAALNTTAERGAARLLRAVLKETFLKGERACRPLIAREGLGPSFVSPALKFLEAAGTQVKFNHRLRLLEFSDGRLKQLDFGDAKISVDCDDMVILAVPSFRMPQIWPSLTAPGDGETIVNVHFKLKDPVTPAFGIPILGLINATAHWAFIRDNMISLTISAAGNLVDEDSDKLTSLLWNETRQALRLGNMEFDAARIIKEKRATFDQSPAGLRRRPPASTAIANLVLAGDWTDTGLPSTIEGAIRSGHTAADIVQQRIGQL